MNTAYENKLAFLYVYSSICQGVKLSWKTVVQNAGSVFAYFCGGHKNNLSLFFLSPLM